MTRVLLVEDHTSFRQLLAFLLDREPDFTVVAQAGSLGEARAMLEGIDLAIVDLDLPDGSGVDLVNELRAANPKGVVLILSGSEDRRRIAQAVEAGASGVLHKSAAVDEIVSAARRLSAGEFLLSGREVADLLRVSAQQREEERDKRLALERLKRLTPREQEVLQAIAEGLGDREIAQRLYVSPDTVRTHVVNLLNKLEADSRLQVVLFAMRHGVVDIP